MSNIPDNTPEFRALVRRILKQDGYVVGGGGGGSGDMTKAVYDANLDNIVDSAASVPWAGITGVPGTFPPSAHNHPQADVTGLVPDLALKAPLASPALTGTPSAPTAAPNTNTTQLATTAYVIGQGYATLTSPALTGTPTAPTAPVDTNTTQVASTAYVIGQASAVVPSNLGAAATGTSLRYARADHVHNRQTSIITSEISANQVTNALLAQIATASFKGRVTAGTGNVEDLTATQATSILNTATTALKGLVPAPGTATGKFLKDDLTWAVPAGGGGSSTPPLFAPSPMVKSGFDFGVDAWNGATAPPLAATLTSGNTLRGVLFPVMADFTLVAFRLNVTTALAAATTRVGLYSYDATNVYPGTLLATTDVGLIDCGTAGVKTSTLLTPLAITKGWYVLAWNTSATATLAVTSLPTTNCYVLPWADPTFPTNRPIGWSVALAMGALPATFTAGAARLTSAGATNIPYILLRAQ